MIKPADNIMNKNTLRTIFSKNEKQISDNASKIADALKKLYTESERAVPEYGDFRAVITNFKNSDKNLGVKDITLSIHPSVLGKERPKERELRISINSLNKGTSYSTVLEFGEKADILKLLQNEKTSQDIQKFIEKASDKFSDLD